MKLGKLLFFFLLLGNFHLLLAENYNYAGFAVTQKGGKKVYSDNHTEIWKNGKHIASKIVYKDANGKAFAEKEINFSKNPNLPDFKLEDSRDGYMEGAMLLPNNKIKLFYRENQNSKAEERVMSIPKNSAIDGGFDFYLKNHWDDLLAGKSISFNFFAPSKLNYYKFQIRMTKKGKYNGKDVVYLKMSLDSFIKLFLPSITIVYNTENKRILYYEGISNINDDNGKSLFVKIYYSHKK